MKTLHLFIGVILLLVSCKSKEIYNGQGEKYYETSDFSFKYPNDWFKIVNHLLPQEEVSVSPYNDGTSFNYFAVYKGNLDGLAFSNYMAKKKNDGLVTFGDDSNLKKINDDYFIYYIYINNPIGDNILKQKWQIHYIKRGDVVFELYFIFENALYDKYVEDMKWILTNFEFKNPHTPLLSLLKP